MSDLEKSFQVINSVLKDVLAAHNLVAARKYELAMSQLSSANSIEEFQQIGILMRDSWIEFSQSMYVKGFLPKGETEPGPSDAKKLLEYTLKHAGNKYEYLLKMAKQAFDFSVKLQHDRNATQEMTSQCLTETGLYMMLIFDCMLRNKLLSKRPYYKCPKCGGIHLTIEKDWVPDIEGAFEVDKLVCRDCSWFYVEELGGISGTGEFHF